MPSRLKQCECDPLSLVLYSSVVSTKADDYTAIVLYGIVIITVLITLAGLYNNTH